MIQQYVLLRTENDLLNSLIGKSFNQKSKFEAEKILDEIHSKTESRMIGKKSLCYIVDKNEILGVGGSTLLKDKNGKIISNLILDQFGEWLARIFKSNNTGIENITMKDFTGVNRTVTIWSTGAVSTTIIAPFASGVFLQIGSGNTPPARIDFFLETIFGTAPENAIFSGGTPVFNSSLGNFKQTGSILAGGAGTINESVLIERLKDTTTTLKFFTMFRDIISPSQAFIVGQTIALEYTIQL